MKTVFPLRGLSCVLLIVFAFINNSCTKRSIKEKIQLMESKAVIIRTDKMMCLSDSDMVSRNKSLKWISYHDSIACKPCQIAHIPDWDQILELECVDCCFILSAKPCEVEKYAEAYRDNNIRAYVYLDTANVFVQDNPRIPRESLFHKFLIDENNNILLVGNPVSNKSVRELFFNILNEKRGRVVNEIKP